MSEFKITVIVPESAKSKMVWLQYVLGYKKFSELLNFTFTVTEAIVKGVLGGKKLALYNMETEEVTLIKIAELEQLEHLRDENKEP